MLRRIYNELAARKSFSEIIVAVAPEFKRQSFRDKCAEALTARTAADHLAGIFRKRIAVLLGDFRTERRSQ